MSKKQNFINHRKENLFIYWVDLFGKTLNVQISGKDKQTTLLGAILGLFSILSIVALSIYFLIDLINKNTVNILFNQNRDLIPTNDFSKTPIVFKLTDGAGRPIPTDGLYEVDVVMAHYIPIKDVTKAQIKYQAIKVNYTRCDYNTSFGEYQHFFKTTPYLDELFCISPNSNNLTLFGKYADVNNGFSYLNFYINKCTNSLTKKCLSEDDMNIQLENVYFAITFLDYQIDHFNTTQVFKPVIKTLAMSMSHNIFKRYFYYIRQIFYDTDYGLIFQESSKQTFYQQDNFQLDVRFPGKSLSSDRSFGLLSILNENKIDLYNRNFRKLQDIFANIGGILKSILICASLTNYIFTRNYSILQIVNNSFEFENDDKYQKHTSFYLPKFQTSTQGLNISSSNFDNLKIIKINKNNVNENENVPNKNFGEEISNTSKHKRINFRTK